MTELIDRAVADGRIAAGRASHWLSMWYADPARTEQLLASMAPGVIPAPPLRVPPIQYWHPWNDPCRLCGEGGHWSTREEAAGVVRMWCGNCHEELSVVFRPWKGQPVHAYVGVDAFCETEIAGPQEWIAPMLAERGYVTVHCGPAADGPRPPTPEEILGGAYWLTLPGRGRADLTGFRTYDFTPAYAPTGADRG